ncbi:unnamed protein product [Peronospora belbahrii]|uniref:Mid2 domain-containing protein n=1 Tax=Peronospora belbahrii TaxID=622444 RepID=A0AAU9L4Y8_9STRA|nr:unnamed protein product [Peronospora belbahrii]
MQSLVTIAIMFALSNAQVYTMRSDLDETSISNSHTDSDRVPLTPTPTGKTTHRMWIPITNPPAKSLKSDAIPSKEKVTSATKPPRTRRDQVNVKTTQPPATKAPKAMGRTPTATNDSSSANLENTADLESNSKPGTVAPSPDLEASNTTKSKKYPKETAPPDDSDSKAKSITFTKSPLLALEAPVPYAVPTADDSKSEKPGSRSSFNLISNELESPSSTTKLKTPDLKTKKEVPKTPDLKTKKEVTKTTSESDSASSSTPSSKSSNSSKPGSSSESSNSSEPGSSSESSESSNSSEPGSSSESSKSSKTDSSSESSTLNKQGAASDIDDTKNPPATPPTASTSTAESISEASSGASVMADSASVEAPGMANTHMLGLMMGGAVALVMLIAVFVYIKMHKNNDEIDDMDPVLQTARLDGVKSTAQSSTMAANFHKNDNMSPTEHDNDNFYPNNQNHNHQYDQDAYGRYHSQGNSVNYNDSNLDMLTPSSQIALAHSEVSLPPMAQTGYSNGSSQYSSSMTHSNFYGDSAYSNDFSSGSQVVKNYPGMRKGNRENDISGSEDESDFEGDATQDMSHATNKWKSAGRNRRGEKASGMDRSFEDTQFGSANSRSTSASDYTGKNRFKESEYTEYRMSTDYENSHVGGGKDYDNSFASSKSGYDNSFAASKSGYDKSFAASDSGYDQSFAASDSGYDQSFAASKSGYDSRHASGKSFESSGFSEYDQHGNGDSSSFYQSKKLRFTDASYK